MGAINLLGEELLQALVAALESRPDLVARLRDLLCGQGEDRMVAAADRPFGLSPSACHRWVAEGRIEVHRRERGLLLAWLSECQRTAGWLCPLPVAHEDSGAGVGG